MDVAFLQERITKTKALIVAYEDAILVLGTDGMQSYTLDTGQDRQTVTKLDLKDLNATLGSLENRLAVYQTRLTGSGTIHARPAW